MELISGTILNERYNVERNVSKGGFSIVYTAIDLQSNVRVCIKELFCNACDRLYGETYLRVASNFYETFQSYKLLFKKEAERLRNLRHSSIINIHDFFYENNTAYIVMDFIEAETLQARMQKKGIKVKESFLIMDQILDAVEYIHLKGIIHHDIKPSNILITAENKIYLLDFGASRDLMYSDNKQYFDFLTESYAPPEQYEKHTKRGTFTDIYALGATLYFILTGRSPQPANDRKVKDYLPIPTQLNAKVSHQLSSAVMLALELNPEDRFQTVHEFRSALNILQRLIKQNLSFANDELLISKTTVKYSSEEEAFTDMYTKTEIKLRQIPRGFLLLFPIADFIFGVICFWGFYEISAYFFEHSKVIEQFGQSFNNFNIINNQSNYNSEFSLILSFSLLALFNFFIEIISGKSVAMNFYKKDIIYNSTYIRSQLLFKLLRILLKFMPLTIFMVLLFLKISDTVMLDMQLISSCFLIYLGFTFLFTVFTGKYYFDALLGTEIKIMDRKQN